MAAQAQQNFPLSSLFQILNLDGKDKILPVIKSNEHYQEMMQQMQAQLEQMGQKLEGLQTENENLKTTVNSAKQSIGNMQARRGGVQQEIPVNKEGENPIVDNARSMMGVPTGANLPT